MSLFFFFWSLFRLLAKAMATHSSIIAWKIPWAEEPGKLQSMDGVATSRTRLSDFTFTFHFHALEKEMATHSSVLAWRIPGTAEPGGLPSTGSHRIGHDWSDLAAAAAASMDEKKPLTVKKLISIATYILIVCFSRYNSSALFVHV